jgi:hypothetical protein
VGERLQRHVDSGHTADDRSPEPGRRDDVVGREGAPVGDDGGDPAVGLLDARDRVPVQETATTDGS